MPIRPGQVESWGLTELVNTGHSNAVIETTRLESARHLRIVDAYVVPITGSQEYGSWFGYPPAPYQRGVEWTRTRYRFVLLVGKKTCPIGWPAKYPT